MWCDSAEKARDMRVKGLQLALPEHDATRLMAEIKRWLAKIAIATAPAT